MKSAVIVCAGNSTRFSRGMNKVLYPLGGKRVFSYSLDIFKKLNFDLIILVVKREEEEFFKEEISENIKIAYGGSRRQDSVLNAIDLIPQNSPVLIHDGARPFLTERLVEEVFSKIRPGRCIVPAIKSEDTIRIENGGKYALFDRNRVFRIQTPQGCVAGELSQLYKRFSHLDLLDDAAAFELANLEVEIVEGEKRNLKITTYEDVKMLEAMMKIGS
ncbi:IspD/TarI family cytidylyltransferase [Athalassotoga saccharophila]|uniref:IspD/TarI family cytidylyltransferase n=1 Tax=Athalassotoga saccharophila TaxID=1441386 RepID=UPI0013799E12|nr:IspD/TarI family cytidylyltransferase [Athalassotoga saccharophila]BBJ29007.1 2-C-methyl-D-erythritol 4-phosphate cytidylyltransferase [Athalassotoga saccharophila]